ncbi:hypothetical protein SK128_018286, partial [Halocaridina rubra]
GEPKIGIPFLQDGPKVGIVFISNSPKTSRFWSIDDYIRCIKFIYDRMDSRSCLWGSVKCLSICCAPHSAYSVL